MAPPWGGSAEAANDPRFRVTTLLLAVLAVGFGYLLCAHVNSSRATPTDQGEEKLRQYIAQLPEQSRPNEVLNPSCEVTLWVRRRLVHGFDTGDAQLVRNAWEALQAYEKLKGFNYLQSCALSAVARAHTQSPEASCEELLHSAQRSLANIHADSECPDVWVSAATATMVEDLRSWPGSSDDWVQQRMTELVDGALLATIVGGLPQSDGEALYARLTAGEALPTLLTDATRMTRTLNV